MSDIYHLTLEDLTFLLELEKSGILLKTGATLNMSPSTASRNFSRICRCFKNPIYKWLFKVLRERGFPKAGFEDCRPSLHVHPWVSLYSWKSRLYLQEEIFDISKTIGSSS